MKKKNVLCFTGSPPSRELPEQKERTGYLEITPNLENWEGMVNTPSNSLPS